MKSVLTLSTLVASMLLLSSCSTAPKLNQTEELPTSRSEPRKPARPVEVVETSSLKDFEKSSRLKFNPSEWKLLQDQDGIQSYEKIKGDQDRVAFRGETIIPAELKKIATVLNTESLRKEWIEGYNETRTVEKTSETDRIEYFHTNVPWPFQDRDFVYRATVDIKLSPPTMLISMTSVEHPREPERAGIVRGEIVYSYYFLKQVEGVRATKVIVEMSVDPKGALPQWLVALSQKKWPYNTLSALKKIAQREDIVVSKEVQEYFNQTKKRGKNK